MLNYHQKLISAARECYHQASPDQQVRRARGLLRKRVEADPKLLSRVITLGIATAIDEIASLEADELRLRRGAQFWNDLF